MDKTSDLIILLYCCPYKSCLKEYRSKFNLKRHVEFYHLGQKPYICSACNKSFVSKQNLIEHQYIHSGVKPYKCTVCGQKFRQVSLLSLHKRTHSYNYQETLSYAIQLQ